MRKLIRTIITIYIISLLGLSSIFSMGNEEKIDTSIYNPPTWVIGEWTEPDGSFMIEVDSDTVYLKYDYKKTGYDVFKDYEPSIDNCKSEYKTMKFNKVIKCDDLPTLYKIEYFDDEKNYKKFIFVFPEDDEITVFEEHNSWYFDKPHLDYDIYKLKKVN